MVELKVSDPAQLKLIKVGDQDQLVAFMYGDVIGVDPNNGDLLWSYPHSTDSGVNVSMPVWGEDNLLFTSSDISRAGVGEQIDADPFW